MQGLDDSLGEVQVPCGFFLQLGFTGLGFRV